MKILDQILFNVSFKTPERSGVSVDVLDIYHDVIQDPEGLMVEDEKTQRVDGWAIHVIPKGEKDGDQLEVTGETTGAELDEYLLGLPEGTTVVTSLVLEDLTTKGPASINSLVKIPQN